MPLYNRIMFQEQSKSTPINFDPLKDYKRTLTQTSGTGSLFFILIMLAVFSIVLWSSIPSDGHVALVLFITAIIVVSAGIVIKVYTQTKKNKLILLDFAEKNGFIYIDKDVNIAEPGTLFDEGDKKNKRRIISGKLSDLDFQSYEYYYTTGSGKNRSVNDAMVFEFTLPRVVPHFVIDSQLEAVLPISFDKSQKIELEGDFHKYFDLYAPDTYGVSALTLLAPDAMEVLLQHAALCDIEIVQNKMYLYWSVPANNQNQYEQIFKTAEAVVTKLKSKLIQDNIYALDSQARVHASPTSDGVKLKQSSLNTYVTIGFIVAYFAINILVNVGSLAKYSFLIYPVLFIGFFAWVLITASKQGKLREEYQSRYKFDNQSKKL